MASYRPLDYRPPVRPGGKWIFFKGKRLFGNSESILDWGLFGLAASSLSTARASCAAAVALARNLPKQPPHAAYPSNGRAAATNIVVRQHSSQLVLLRQTARGQAGKTNNHGPREPRVRAERPGQPGLGHGLRGRRRLRGRREPGQLDRRRRPAVQEKCDAAVGHG